jgi:GNAT superfamily N-acetyltransferase
MLDKTIPYFGVIMVKDNIKEYPKYNLPNGYSFCMYEDGYENYWAKLEYRVGEFNSFEAAFEYFDSEFIRNKEELYKRCIFVKNEAGEIIATASIWYGNHFGDKLMQRIHWVAVDPDYQGNGIAKALITKTLDTFNELGLGDILYLTTQTWSFKAINIYMKFGFKPYMGEKPVNWKTKSQNFEEENKKAWDIIFDRINNR